MGYVGKVTAGGSTHLVGSTLYGTCATAAATAAKVVTCADFTTLLTGVTIHVKFTYANGVANPTLNVNGTGAKNIYRYGTTAPSTSAASSWQAGAVVTFTYDGTYWIMNDWLNDNTNTLLRVYRQSSSTYNADYPLLVSRTKAASIGTSGTDGSNSAVYGVMWNDTTKVPTLNPSTGEIKAVKFSGEINGTYSYNATTETLTI